MWALDVLLLVWDLAGIIASVAPAHLWVRAGMPVPKWLHFLACASAVG
jgi:hypothetical protein